MMDIVKIVPDSSISISSQGWALQCLKRQSSLTKRELQNHKYTLETDYCEYRFLICFAFML